MIVWHYDWLNLYLHPVNMLVFWNHFKYPKKKFLRKYSWSKEEILYCLVKNKKDKWKMAVIVFTVIGLEIQNLFYTVKKNIEE